MTDDADPDLPIELAIETTIAIRRRRPFRMIIRHLLKDATAQPERSER
jgi:hypothetical protein